MIAVDVQGLRKVIRTDFYRPAKTLVEDVSFQVPSSSITGFIGHNGAGKSTTIKVLIGAIRKYEGQVHVLGRAPTDAEARAKVGYLPELPRLAPNVTPAELLRTHAVLARVPASERSGRIDGLLERVGLSSVRDQRVGSYSKGMQQRLALALAFVGDPALLILDEPMSGLDPSGRRLVRELLLTARADGRTILFSSHVLPDVEALCDGVCVIDKGRTVASGSVSDIFARHRLGTDIVFRPGDDRAPTPQSLGLPDGVLVEARGDHYAAVLDAGTDPVDVAQAVRASGAAVVSVESRRLSLEDEVARFIAKNRGNTPFEPAGAPEGGPT